MVVDYCHPDLLPDKFLIMQEVIKVETKTEIFTPEECFITEILNVEDFRSFSIAKARVLPGITTRNHKLNETDEVYYILEGKGEMEINGKNLGTAKKGDAVFIPKNANQRITNSGNDDLVFLCICAPRFEPGNYQADNN